MRTPLNSIIQTSEQLLSSIKDEKGRKLQKINYNSAKMLLCLVNDLLDLFQIKNYKFSKRMTNFEISECMEEIRSLIDI
jgi:signal transduction histidine kinase